MNLGYSSGAPEKADSVADTRRCAFLKPLCSVSIGDFNPQARPSHDPLRLLQRLGDPVPSQPCTCFQLLLSGLYERSIMLLRDLNAAVSQQQRNLVKRDSRKQELHRKRVSEHVRMATPGLVIPVLQVYRLE